MSSNNELTLPEIQQISYEILLKVKEVCDRCSLKYFLAYGTLIGAVRHNGFIPWDDDLDIMMPRPDYEKFIKYFEENEDSLYPLKVFNKNNTRDYPYMISRVSNVDYILQADNECSYGLGVFIDIYPLDGMGNDYDECIRIKKRAARLSSLCYLSTRKKCKREMTSNIVKRIMKYPAFFVSKVLGKKYFMQKLENYKNRFNYSDSNYVSCVVWGSSIKRGIFEKSLFDDGIELFFNDQLFNAPKKYKEILSLIYDDYMVLPPEEERIGQHFYKVYKK